MPDCDDCLYGVDSVCTNPKRCTILEDDTHTEWKQGQQKITSDGSTASYYELPEGATELQHLISHRNMNAQVGEIFRACYRMGMVSHSPAIRDVKKIIFYAQAELERLEKCR